MFSSRGTLTVITVAGDVEALKSCVDVAGHADGDGMSSAVVVDGHAKVFETFPVEF